jgi:hypothetical protein
MFDTKEFDKTISQDPTVRYLMEMMGMKPKENMCKNNTQAPEDMVIARVDMHTHATEAAKEKYNFNKLIELEDEFVDGCVTYKANIWIGGFNREHLTVKLYKSDNRLEIKGNNGIIYTDINIPLDYLSNEVFDSLEYDVKGGILTIYIHFLLEDSEDVIEF